MDNKLINEFTERLNAALAQSPAADFEKNLRAALTGLFARFDLVTREEFDIQLAVLERTRGRLEALEARLAALEESTSKPAPKP